MSPDQNILFARNISKTFGDKTILTDVSVCVGRGETKVLIGPSGGGKSTFLQCLNYLIQPDQGEVYLEGKLIDGQNKKALYHSTGLFFIGGWSFRQ